MSLRGSERCFAVSLFYKIAIKILGLGYDCFLCSYGAHFYVWFNAGLFSALSADAGRGC